MANNQTASIFILGQCELQYSELLHGGGGLGTSGHKRKILLTIHCSFASHKYNATDPMDVFNLVKPFVIREQSSLVSIFNQDQPAYVFLRIV